MTSHLRWILCSAIAVGLWVELNKRQNMVTELCEANTNLADELHRAEGYNFWDGVAAGESLHRN